MTTMEKYYGDGVLDGMEMAMLRLIGDSSIPEAQRCQEPVSEAVENWARKALDRISYLKADRVKYG